MDYEAAENQIVTRLNATFTALGINSTYEAVLFPEDETSFNTFYSSLTKATIAVCLINIRPELSNGIGSAIQEESSQFRTVFFDTHFRGDGGLLKMMAYTKQSLIGYKIDDATRLTLIKFGTLDQRYSTLDSNFVTADYRFAMMNHGVDSFQYYFDFECKSENVQVDVDFEDDLPYPGTLGAALTEVCFVPGAD
jgi:hypothetical protein